MKKKLIILALIAIIPLLAISTIPEVQGAINLNQQRIKIVVDFEYPANIQKLNSDYNKDLSPEIDIIANNFGADYTSFSHLVSLDLAIMGENVTSGNTMYQVYPKVILTGNNSTKSDSDFAMEFNTTVALLRIAIMDFLTANGATEVSTHIHFTYGSFDFDEGF